MEKSGDPQQIEEDGKVSRAVSTAKASVDYGSHGDGSILISGVIHEASSFKTSITQSSLTASSFANVVGERSMVVRQ